MSIMPTNQKRHTCSVCGCKRVEKYMKIARFRKFSHIAVWVCDTRKLNEIINGSIYCSKRTPQGGV